jgi:hypothetical protein
MAGRKSPTPACAYLRLLTPTYACPRSGFLKNKFDRDLLTRKTAVEQQRNKETKAGLQNDSTLSHGETLERFK